MMLDEQARIAASAFDALRVDDLLETYWHQGEFVFVENAFAPSLVRELVDEFEALRHDSIHRSWIPGGIKVGNVGYGKLRERAPRMTALYQSPALLERLSRLARKDLALKGLNDEHSCSIYAYTKPGDKMAYHYDGCGCDFKASYTLILGLINRSRSRFRAQLHRRAKGREAQQLELSTSPGSMLFFCGDNVRHAVSPLGSGEERVVLSMSYVARGRQVKGFRRFTETLKDAVLHFGPSYLLHRNYRQEEQDPAGKP